MCGIIGMVCNQPLSVGVLLDALQRLEYRGYDSCGVATVMKHTITIQKTVGNTAALRKQINEEELFTTGFAHTRWATHGPATKKNAHPHQVDDVILVHNGIIENAEELRKIVTGKGILLQSDTDTEVAAALFALEYAIDHDAVRTIRTVSKQLIGSYAFVLLFRDQPEKLYALRHDSPLVCGYGFDACYIASDESAFASMEVSCAKVTEEEIVVLTGNRIVYIQRDGCSIEKTPEQQNHSELFHALGDFDSYLYKEIQEEAEVAKRLISAYTKDQQRFPSINSYRQILFIACGSAYHAGATMALLWQRALDIECIALHASEFRYSQRKLRPDSIAIFISQSGETADTLAALRLCKAEKLATVAVVNVENSAMAKEADYSLFTMAKREVSVATTKAYMAQLLTLALWGSTVFPLAESAAFHNDLIHLPALLAQETTRQLSQLAHRICQAEHVYFLGRQSAYFAAQEGALKLKEISYIHAEAYPAGEMKHGPIALVEDGTPIIVLVSERALLKKTLSNLAEVQARGAYTVLILPQSLLDETVKADEIIPIPDIHPLLLPIFLVLPLQLLAYETAKQKGCPLDQPRNLAKSVTVE